MQPPPVSASELQNIFDANEFEQLAQARLSPMAYEYLCAGVAGEVTVRENRLAFERIRLRPRVCVDVTQLDTTVSLFGRVHPHPILLAPCGFHTLFHHDAELAAAEGAARAESTLVTATFSSVSLEKIARASARPLWFQLYVQPDRGFTSELVRRAEAAGYEALVVTVDVPVNGPRYRELRAGFALPPGVNRANLMGLGEDTAHAPHRPHGRNIYTAVRAPDVTWKDIQWLKSITRMPVIVKGILDEDDAAVAVERGADAIYVSNHGGRSVDTLPAALDALPGIADRIGGRVPVLFDGGIRHGTDVFKALAFGAAAVFVGRPYVFGLATAGAEGVTRVIEILRTELEMTMGLTGVTHIRGIGRGALW